MSVIQWDSFFDEIHAEPGASDDEIAEFISTALNPLSTDEIAWICREQKNPFPKNHPLYSKWQPFDPAEWSIPAWPFPHPYLDLLKWSNGAECRTGHRRFQFFPANDPSHGVRAMLLAYDVPQYMPGAIPFAFSGGGTFYMFDMREPANDGEYPILCSDAGCLGFDDAVTIAGSFIAACQGQTDVDTL